MDFDQLLTAASQAMSAPENIVARSARAKASATGVTPEQILAEWAGVDAGDVPAPTAVPDPAAAAVLEPAAAQAVAAPTEAPVDVEVVAPRAEAPAPEPEPPQPEPEEEPEEVLVGSAGIRAIRRFSLPGWLTASFVIVPLAALFYAATFATGPECGKGGALAVDPVSGFAENCDGTEFGSVGGNLLQLGAALFTAEAAPPCQACHGADGGGGAGPALAGGEVVTTFSRCEDHIQWVSLGTVGWSEEIGPTYGDNNKPVGGFGVMQGYTETGLSLQEIAAVVLYERVTFGGLDAAEAESDCNAALAAAAGN